MKKIITTCKGREILLYIGLFVLTLAFIMLTIYAADDFRYGFSFATNEPLENVWQIFPSMAAHTQTMNGRLSAHFLVQIFMLLPMWVFDVVNAGMFCLQIWLISSFAFEKEKSNLRTIGIFCGIWLWELAFGEVNLWQDGAVNYLWSVVFILLFLRPFAAWFLSGEGFSRGKVLRTGFVAFSFFVGSYSETASAAAIFVAALLLVLDAFCNRRKIHGYGLICTVAAFLGYVSIYLAPAQWMNKSTEFSVVTLLRNFETATLGYASFGVLAGAFVVLLVISLMEKMDIKRILLALSLAAGSLAANYIMVLAKYYSGRSSVAAFLLLLSAVMVLFSEVMAMEKWKTIAVSALALLMLACVPELVRGTLDIGFTYIHMRENENRIQQCIDRGETEAVLTNISPATEYSAIYGLKYLDLEDSASWPNDSMAKYYGLDVVHGK